VSVPTLRERYDAVYLSPHLDDAVLSCGGQIHRRAAAGEAVLVVTVGAADEPPPPWSDLATTLHRAWGGAAGVVARRRREDRAACRVLGADALHLGLPEAIYRRRGEDGAPFYPTLRSLFGAVAPEDAGFAEAIVGELRRRLPAWGELVAPLGVGGHVDHVLTRRAAELLGSGAPLLYEEFPYAARLRWAGGTRRLAGPGAGARVVPLDAADLQARYRAILAYESQVRPLFRSPERLRGRLERHVRRVGGERLWERRATA
jgi:LmbE family N-acetylglucosaminyl deacetylase